MLNYFLKIITKQLRIIALVEITAIQSDKHSWVRRKVSPNNRDLINLHVDLVNYLADRIMHLVNYLADRIMHLINHHSDLMDWGNNRRRPLPLNQFYIILFDNIATLASNNQVNKYPTLKLYRYGTATKKEYRGQRSVESFLTFVKEQIANPIKIARSQIEYQTQLVEVSSLSL